MSRRPTSTSSFGVSRRESHDSSRFYERFAQPEISEDEWVAPERCIDKMFVGDARHMDEIPDASVALVVTSPPYFAGKEYEETLGHDGVPATYLGYLDLLRDVFAECAKKLEPGGRMAVNVANLGRRPYRSLSADVIGILQDDLRLLLRGEIIWVKQRGAAGSCAWGSFQRPANPVLRDVTERVVVAAKGRFDRALPVSARAAGGLPHESSMTREDFMEYTLDLWEVPAESARRVGHPAPFPVELPSRLIQLFTYRGDLVLDPFAGSGTTAVAALRSGRHYVGFDTDDQYIDLAESRIASERERLVPMQEHLEVGPPPVEIHVGRAGGARKATVPKAGDGHLEAAVSGRQAHAAAVAEGRAAADIAAIVIEAAGFRAVERDRRLPGGVQVAFSALDARGHSWVFDLVGGFTTHRPGLNRPDAVWKSIGRAATVRAVSSASVVLLTCGSLTRHGGAARALRRVTGEGLPVRAVVDVLDPAAVRALSDLLEPGGD